MVYGAAVGSMRTSFLDEVKYLPKQLPHDRGRFFHDTYMYSVA
jgi:hypothetical protein